MQHIIKKAFSLFRKGMIKCNVYKIKRYIKIQNTYTAWPVCSEIEIEQQTIKHFLYEPKISLIVPMYNTPLAFFKELLESVVSQTYSNWELCLADGTACDYETSDYIKNFCTKDKRIKYCLLSQNKGIANNTNEALKMADGDFIGFIDHDDVLAKTALFEIVKVINENNSVEMIYTDEDKVDEVNHKLFMPHFKPDFNEAYFLSVNYICHFFVVKRNVARNVGGFDSCYEGAQDYEFILRCMEYSKNIVHISKPLYHWRMHNGSTSERPEGKLYAFENGRRAIENYYFRKGINVRVRLYPGKYGYYIADYSATDCNDLTIVQIGGRNIIEMCKKNHIPYHILKDADVDNINECIKNIKTKFVLLVDDYIDGFEIRDIKNMLGCIKQGNVFGVVAKTVYQKRIQYGGSIVGMPNVLNYAFYGNSIYDEGYFGRASVAQDTFFATSGCFIFDREIFNRVNGLNPSYSLNVAVADLCFKIRKVSEKRIIYLPSVVLELKHRTKIFKNKHEKDLFFKTWKEEILAGDPYYNKNLSLKNAHVEIKTVKEIIDEGSEIQKYI